jgi:hypothetical protein
MWGTWEETLPKTCWNIMMFKIWLGPGELDKPRNDQPLGGKKTRYSKAMIRAAVGRVVFLVVF